MRLCPTSSALRRAAVNLRPARLAITLLLLAVPAAAQRHPPAATRPRRAVLILAPGLDAERFLQILGEPPYRQLAAASAIGVLNPAVRGPKTVGSACLTIGAGERCSAGETTQPVMLVQAPFEGGTAGQAYERRTGQSTGGAQAVVLGWPAVLAANPGSAGRPLGSLAGALQVAGRRVTYVGEVTAGGAVRSAAVLAACDPYGRIQRLRPVRSRAALDRALSANSGEGLLVAGLTPGPGGTAERSALDLAARLAPRLSPESDLFILAAPSPASPASQAARFPGTGDDTQQRWELDRLCPVLVWGRGWEGKALRSSTTQTPGLIANIDLAPTILAHLELPVPRVMGGRPVRAEAGGSRDRLDSLFAYAHQTRVNRRAFIPALVLWGGFGVLAAALAVTCLLSDRGSGFIQMSRAAITLVTTVPVAMLVAGGFRFFSARNLLFFTGLAAVALAVICGLLARGRPSRRSPVLVAYLITTAAVIADAFAGAHRLSISVLSDFPVTGMRFYGIGNEYMGVLLGVAMMTVPWAWQLMGHERLDLAGWLAALAVWSAVTITLGAPALGADLGGGLAALVSALATARLCGARLPWAKTPVRELLVAGVVVTAAALLLFTLDAMRPPEAQTHLGTLVRDVRENPQHLAEVIQRKALMNLRLTFSGWFLGSLAVVAPVLWVWYHRAGARSFGALRRRPLLRAGIAGTFAGGIAALLLNDSGIVAWGIITAGCLAAWLDTLLAERLVELTPELAP